MGRMDLSGSETKEIEISFFGGQNTAKTFSEIEGYESARMLNALPRKIGGLAKRDGTVPLTTTALLNPIKVLCNLRKDGVNNILATSGTTLYKYGAGVLTGQTMTNALVTADIDYAQFKDDAGAEVLVIADGGNLKKYDGTAVVNITPAADDPPELPPNDLANINTNHPPIGCLVHNTRVVIWDGSDTIWHSKFGFYDYFSNLDYQRFVRENDYVVGCVSYSGALMVLMRRHIGVLFGFELSDWKQDFLDTSEGCLNAKTIQTVTYPNGTQEVFYLSDNGVHAIYTIDTLSLDSSARYSTKSMTKNKIDWEGLGVTKAEWAKATGYFHDSRYWLIYPKGTERLGLVFNTNDAQWYPIDNIQANSFYEDEDYFYYAGDEGHLRVFDDTLYSDWDDVAKTTGTPINWYWYSKLMTPKATGLNHFWDILMIEAKQHDVNSTLDVEVNTYRGQFTQIGAIKTAYLVVGVTKIGEAQIANTNFTDLINEAKRIRTFLSGQYAQIKLYNNRDEPMEIFGLVYEVRPQTKY
jgi:hypothetical protein